MKRSYGGAERGKGAVYAWEGDKNVGSGRMEILEAARAVERSSSSSISSSRSRRHNTAEFTMLPQGDATNVTWLMHGPATLHDQGDAGVHQPGQDDRQGFRSRVSPI